MLCIAAAAIAPTTCSSTCTHSVMVSFHRIAVPCTPAFLVDTLMLRAPPLSSTAAPRHPLLAQGLPRFL
jgi:hypothetical protein